MATREQIVDGIRAGAGQRAVASEVETAVYQTISELKAMIFSLMDQNEKTKAKLDLALSYNAKVEALAAKVDLAVSTQGKLDKVVAASLLMAAKVDATATPVTSFVATFNNNI